jgi:hypothetical protein
MHLIVIEDDLLDDCAHQLLPLREVHVIEVGGHSARELLKPLLNRPLPYGVVLLFAQASQLGLQARKPLAELSHSVLELCLRHEAALIRVDQPPALRLPLTQPALGRADLLLEEGAVQTRSRTQLVVGPHQQLGVQQVLSQRRPDQLVEWLSANVVRSAADPIWQTIRPPAAIVVRPLISMRPRVDHARMLVSTAAAAQQSPQEPVLLL